MGWCGGGGSAMPIIRFATVNTDLGQFGLAASDAGLRAVALPGADLRRRLLSGFADGLAVEDPAYLMDLADRLRAYCGGALVSFDDLTLDVVGTPFQLAVWGATRSIPRGQTRSYGQIAAQVGRPGAARAVGAAQGANPGPIVVPCHRVVGSDGALRGFGGGLPLKARLLVLEGLGAYSRQYPAVP